MLRVQRLLKVAVATTTIAATLGLGIGSVATASAAAPTYTIVSGDSLIGISNKLHVSLTALLDTNHLVRTSVIHPGQVLTVPATATTVTAAPVAAPAAAPAVTPAPAAAAVRTYTVKSGDSLIAISNRLQVTLVALLDTNHLVRTSVIHPGQVLTVPASAPQAATPAPAAAPAAVNAVTGAVPSTLVYVVKPNDFLLGIAAQTGVTLDALLAVNNLVRSSVIHPGDKLVVPAGGHLPAATAAPATGTVSTAGLDARIAKVLDFARAQLGKPYRFAAAGPDAFDCSGLTMAAYSTIKVNLPHYSVAQSEKGTAVDWTTTSIKAGDLVFLADPTTGVINHVGIAISSTQWIHAPRTGDVVRTGTIPAYRIVAVRRLIETA